MLAFAARSVSDGNPVIRLTSSPASLLSPPFLPSYSSTTLLLQLICTPVILASFSLLLTNPCQAFLSAFLYLLSRHFLER